MGLIQTHKHLEQNILNVEKYIAIGTEEEKSEIRELIKRGICFVAYNVGNETRFAPSRFLGYVYNELYKHKYAFEKDGRDTNKSISKIIRSKPNQNKVLESKYIEYCRKLGITPRAKGSYGVVRKYWVLENRITPKHESKK